VVEPQPAMATQAASMDVRLGCDYRLSILA